MDAGVWQALQLAEELGDLAFPSEQCLICECYRALQGF